MLPQIKKRLYIFLIFIAATNFCGLCRLPYCIILLLIFLIPMFFASIIAVSAIYVSLYRSSKISSSTNFSFHSPFNTHATFRCFSRLCHVCKNTCHWSEVCVCSFYANMLLLYIAVLISLGCISSQDIATLISSDHFICVRICHCSRTDHTTDSCFCAPRDKRGQNGGVHTVFIFD